jgi:CRISPR-associated protein Cse2 (CRISPR_cse2)
LLPLIQAARQRQIPINYERLFLDLWYWSEPVKKRWAGQFLAAKSGARSAEKDTPEADS